ncbi:MAG: retroviral-like aspartic protease [Aggregatilineales bacterium]
MTFAYHQKAIEVVGLVHSGSTVNVLPYSVGLRLGVEWDNQPVIPGLVGSLRSVGVRALDVFAFHPQLAPQTPIHLVFAWAKSDEVPVILGQMNFFLIFKVCFYRAEDVFEVTLQ